MFPLFPVCHFSLLNPNYLQWIPSRFVCHGLTTGLNYVFRVKAVNAAGYSQSSASSDAVIVQAAICEYFLQKKKKKVVSIMFTSMLQIQFLFTQSTQHYLILPNTTLPTQTVQLVLWVFLNLTYFFECLSSLCMILHDIVRN